MTIKYYDLQIEVDFSSGEERFVKLGVTCAENGKYVRREDYEAFEKALRDEIMILTHKVITCGVAARHPDRNLSRTGAYAGKWDSPQAEDVRKLRDKYEEASLVANEYEEWIRFHASGDGDFDDFLRGRIPHE